MILVSFEAGSRRRRDWAATGGSCDARRDDPLPLRRRYDRTRGRPDPCPPERPSPVGGLCQRRQALRGARRAGQWRRPEAGPGGVDLGRGAPAARTSAAGRPHRQPRDQHHPQRRSLAGEGNPLPHAPGQHRNAHRRGHRPLRPRQQPRARLRLRRALRDALDAASCRNRSRRGRGGHPGGPQSGDPRPRSSRPYRRVGRRDAVERHPKRLGRIEPAAGREPNRRPVPGGRRGSCSERHGQPAARPTSSSVRSTGVRTGATRSRPSTCGSLTASSMRGWTSCTGTPRTIPARSRSIAAG